MTATTAPTALQSFLQAAFEEHLEINDGSNVACVTPLVEPGSAIVRRYGLTLTGVEHFERRDDGSVETSRDRVEAEISFADDYLRSTDPRLGFRVARISSPVFHPNRASARAVAAAAGTAVGAPLLAATSGVVCLGSGFRPGTRLRAVVFQLYRIVAGRDFATNSPLDLEASRWFLEHRERVGALTSPTLWRERLSRGVADTAGTPDPEVTA